MSQLPQFPFSGQILIDFYGVQWQYDPIIDGWKRLGDKEDIPLADGSQSGLLSPVLKNKIDGIPDRGGGCSIIVKTVKRSLDNMDGILVGDINLTSHSLDITCVDSNGNQISGGCAPDVEAAGDARQPGFNFQIKQKTLDGLCIRVPGIPGPKGQQGDKGDPGQPGTGDGPQGVQGEPGKDETEPGTFTGVKILDDPGIYDNAVVGLDLDADNGVLNVIKSKVRVPTDNTPANQVIAQQISRDVVFTGNRWDFQLGRPSGDPLEELDPDMLHMPSGFEPDGNTTTELSSKKLSTVLQYVINRYDEDLQKVEAQYDKELRDYILSKDEECRNILAALAQQLSECEWKLPIDFCLGISPGDCIPDESSTEGVLNCVRRDTIGLVESVSDFDYVDYSNPTAPVIIDIDATDELLNTGGGLIENVEVTVEYENGAGEDTWEIIYGGETIAEQTDTGSGSFSGTATGSSPIVQIKVTPGDSGTAWTGIVTATFGVCLFSTPSPGPITEAPIIAEAKDEEL